MRKHKLVWRKHKTYEDGLLLLFESVSGVFAHVQLHILNVIFRLTAVCEIAMSNKKRKEITCETRTYVLCVGVKFVAGRGRRFHLQSTLKLHLSLDFNYIIELIYSTLISWLLNWVIKLSHLNQLCPLPVNYQMNCQYISGGFFLKCGGATSAARPLHYCDSSVLRRHFLSLLRGSKWPRTWRVCGLIDV